jgi:hypothetical protein
MFRPSHRPLIASVITVYEKYKLCSFSCMQFYSAFCYLLRFIHQNRATFKSFYFQYLVVIRSPLEIVHFQVLKLAGEHSDG